MYRCEDGVVSCQTLPAEEAAELLESGVYFQCPTKAKEEYLVPTSNAVKDVVEKIDESIIEHFRENTDPSQMDKRTKEYKEWKAAQEDSE